MFYCLKLLLLSHHPQSLEMLSEMKAHLSLKRTQVQLQATFISFLISSTLSNNLLYDLILFLSTTWLMLSNSYINFELKLCWFHYIAVQYVNSKVLVDYFLYFGKLQLQIFTNIPINFKVFIYMPHHCWPCGYEVSLVAWVGRQKEIKQKLLN